MINSNIKYELSRKTHINSYLIRLTMTWKQSFLEAKSRLNDPRELCMSFMCSYDALQAVCLSTHYLVHWIVHVVWLLDLVLQKAWFFSSVHSYSWPNPHLCCILWGVIKRQVPSIEVDLRCIEYRCISYKLGTWFSTGFFCHKNTATNDLETTKFFMNEAPELNWRR